MLSASKCWQKNHGSVNVHPKSSVEDDDSNILVASFHSVS